jgi:hypothetical protein
MHLPYSGGLASVFASAVASGGGAGFASGFASALASSAEPDNIWSNASFQSSAETISNAHGHGTMP